MEMKYLLLEDISWELFKVMHSLSFKVPAQSLGNHLAEVVEEIISLNE